MIRFAVPALLLLACAGTPPRLHEDPRYDVARARARHGDAAPGFEWAEWAEATFARARAEGRYILFDGVAEWCHWCHVMDATTYRDPEVARILREKFVAIRADIDARPDLGERYAAWGWPATIILTPDAREIGKYRGYLEPAELRDILLRVERLQAEARTPPDRAQIPPVEALPWIGARVGMDLDRFYDREQGGWGRRQKLPLGANVEVELRRAARGDAEARERALFTLRQQRRLIDPVWGGVFQYSVRGVWNEPHFEKLMTIQGPCIEAWAAAHAATGDPALAADARRVADYVRAFLTDRDGAFLVSQDADVGAHDPKARFVDGHHYYALDDAGRRALGLPRVDRGVYPYQNGLAIAAFAALHSAAGAPEHLAAARRAAAVVTGRLMDTDGRLRRETKHGAEVRYLADAATFGRGLARLAEVTGDVELRVQAERIADVMLADFADPDTGALFGTTPDPSAAGVFAERRRPFRHNVTAARFLATLTRVTGDPRWRDAGRRLLAGIATPAGLAAEGRMVGDFLLALDELGLYRWE